MFLTGGGALSQSVGTGVLGPIPPPVMVESIVVGVDDKGSTVPVRRLRTGFSGSLSSQLRNTAGCRLRREASQYQGGRLLQPAQLDRNTVPLTTGSYWGGSLSLSPGP